MMSRESILRRMFPLLTNFIVVSEPTRSYNCIAWAVHDTNRWWDPDPNYYWPADAARAYSVDALVEAYGGLGYALCQNGNVINGIEKIAIYADASGDFTHVSRQLRDGSGPANLAV